MLIKRVVINASPLIVLFKSQQADLLPQLFSEIIVPVGVWDEVTGTIRRLKDFVGAGFTTIFSVAPGCH